MLETLKKLLGISVKKHDVLLKFALDNAIEMVLNYCNIKKIPQGLESTIIRMAMDIYRQENLGNEGAASETISIKEGDTETKFQLTGLSDSYMAGLLKDYKTQLNKYRKVSW